MTVSVLKLLSEKTSSFEQGSASVDSLTQADVAGAMGLLKHEGAELFGHVKFAGHTPMLRKIEALMRPIVQKIAVKNDWNSSIETIDALIRLAILEKISDWNCPNCKGTGELFVSKASLRGRPPVGKDMIKATCPVCEGHTKTFMSDNQRLKAVGISRRSWRHWKPRYRNDILPIVDEFEYVLHRYLNFQSHEKKR